MTTNVVVRVPTESPRTSSDDTSRGFEPRGEVSVALSAAPPTKKFKWYQTPPSVNRWLLNVAGFTFNLAAYAFVTTMTLRCMQLGARAFELGIVNGVLAIAGTVGCLVFGALSDKIPATLVSRVGAILYLAASACLMFTKNLPLAYVAAICGGLAEAAFWPSVEGLVGKEARIGHSDSAAAEFNVWMAAGKALGCLCAGFLFPILGNSKSLLLVIGGNVLVFAFMPLASRQRGRSAPTSTPDQRLSVELVSRGKFKASPQTSPALSEDPLESPKPSMDVLIPAETSEPGPSETMEEDDNRSRVFLPLSYIANCILYGVAGTIASLYPQFMSSKGLAVGKIGGSEELYGLCMGTLWGLQAIAFGILTIRRIPWQFRRWLLFLFQFLALAATALLAHVTSGWQVIVLAVPIGGCVGFSAMSSLAYSLRMSKTKKGAFAGVHEALVQLGTAVMPIVAGFLVTGSKEPRSAYWLCAALVLGSLVVQEGLYHVGLHKQRRKLVKRTQDTLAHKRAKAASVVSLPKVPVTDC